VITAVRHKQPFFVSLWQYELNNHITNPNCCIIKEYTLQLYQYIVAALNHGITQNEFLPNLELSPTAFALLGMIHMPTVPVLLLTELDLSAPDACTNYVLQAVRYYLQGIQYTSIEG